MKKYEKPTLEIVQLRVSENIAVQGDGNTTKYKMNQLEAFAMGVISADGDILGVSN